MLNFSEFCLGTFSLALGLFALDYNALQQKKLRLYSHFRGAFKCRNFQSFFLIVDFASDSPSDCDFPADSFSRVLKDPLCSILANSVSELSV